MSKFAGIGEASSTRGGNYFKPGLYAVRVRECKLITSRQKDDLFIVECEVLKSSHESIVEGSTASWIVNMKHDASLGNIKGFLAAALDCLEEEIDEEACELAISKENPLKNAEVDLECVLLTTRKGGEFTKHMWSPAEAK